MSVLRNTGLSLSVALMVLSGDIARGQSSAPAGLVGTWHARLGPVAITLTCTENDVVVGERSWRRSFPRDLA